MSRAKPLKKDNREFYQNLSCNLRYFRENAGVRSGDLAEQINISPSYLATLESPARWEDHPSLEIIFDISKALNIAPSCLFMNLKDAIAARESGRKPDRSVPYDTVPERMTVREPEPGLYEMRLADVIDLYRDDPEAFMEDLLRHYRKRNRGGRTVGGS